MTYNCFINFLTFFLSNKIIYSNFVVIVYWFRCYCIKGVGRDHAKFSPVATATYRLLPDIKLTRSIGGEQAHRLKSSFSDGVIGIDESGFGLSFANIIRLHFIILAYVKDPRKDTSSRNVFQHEDLKGAVEMRKIKDHFICTLICLYVAADLGFQPI